LSLETAIAYHYSLSLWSASASPVGSFYSVYTIKIVILQKYLPQFLAESLCDIEVSELGFETRLTDLKSVLFLPSHPDFTEECMIIKTDLGEG
jgi:hypothetical protein